ncbi:MAG: helix-turn-helix domain-containing protein [Proteobacteria bacterium]|jgi:excisionase family DNA binding protein|nr:helix-turn-helix domain-containing protein [Pseudomonadota bacterium]
MKSEVDVAAGAVRKYASSAIPFAERPTCTVAEACSAVGFGKTKLYELLDGGAVDSVRIGRRRLIRVPSLLQFLEPTK